MSLSQLQEALPTWVTIERKHGDPVVSHSQAGDVPVTVLMEYPEAPPVGTMAGDARVDLHFVAIAPTEGLPEKDELVKLVRSALDEDVFQPVTAELLGQGLSYIHLGAWLGSQDLALMLIGAVELVGLAKAITPQVFGITGDNADEMAGLGMINMGVWGGWIGELEKER